MHDHGNRLHVKCNTCGEYLIYTHCIGRIEAKTHDERMNLSGRAKNAPAGTILYISAGFASHDIDGPRYRVIETYEERSKVI